MTGRAATSETPRRLARADREEQILGIAHRQFATRGFGAVTMEEIAAEAGVTKPLLYAYFGNKDRLYEACMEPAGEALVEAVIAAVAGAGDATDALASGVRAFFAFVDSDRDAWRVLFDETLPAGGAMAQRAAAYRERIAGLLSDTIGQTLTNEQRGHPQTAAVVEALSVSLMAAAEQLARWFLRTGALSAGQAADLLIATVAPGLARVAANPPSNQTHKDSTR
ncbi:MAG: helix-turn-helix domain-containing protein [Baekduia sp.]